MVEFLIMNKEHWTTDPKIDPKIDHEEKRKTHKHWDEKVADQYVLDDIIEIRLDGFWTGPKARGFNKKAFRVISAPGKAKHYMNYQTTSPTHKSRFSIPTGRGNDLTVVSSMNDLTITDKG
jgi:hypothetical protein